MILQAINRSIRNKVVAVVMLTTFVALLVSTGTLLTYEIDNYREFAATDLVTQADILARSAASSLAFRDPEAATDTLAPLKSRPGILAAAIYTASGELFATTGAKPSPNRAVFGSPSEPRFDGNNISLFHPIIQNEALLGTVYLEAQHDLYERIGDYLLILLTVSLLSLLVAVIVSIWLQGGVTQPILAVTDTARRIIEQRDFKLRARRTTDDEIGVLVDAFNSMVGEVGQRTEELETANRRLREETEERRSAEAALRAADQRKDEFLALLAHELRNPLAPIVNAMSLLRAPKADATITQRAYDIMDRQLAHMVRLVDDLLDVARITRGKLAIHKQPVELADVLRNAVDTVRPLLEGRSHRFVMNLPQQPIYLQADPVRLAQVFSNLLNNAAKYSEAGGDITLKAEVVGSSVRVVVADAGIGISAETLPGIFDMFARGDHSAERAAGLGVGLALARQLIDLHGGTIHAHSPGLGSGSTFTVTLPVMAALTAQRSVADVKAQTTRDLHRILLVDDNVDFVTSLAILMKRMGHEVRVAHDADQALIAAADFRPQFAFLDVGLPVVNGYELAKRLKARPETADTVLIAVSGWGQEKDRQQAEEAGFALHLVKPVASERIQSAIDSLRGA
jgi:signal transduction histidine kinase/ActR/RegA family two-component response regulator